MLVIGFEEDSYTVSETDGTLQVCVSLVLDPALMLPIERITLQMITVEGTAGS